MKKILTVVAVFVFFATTAFAELNVKVGVDTLGKITGDNDFSENVKLGTNFSAEYLYSLFGILGAGIGAEYLAPRDIDVTKGGNFSLLPVYATVKVKIPLFGIYAKANAGYNFPLASDLKDTKGGTYLSAALGWEFLLGLFLEANYGIYNFGAKVEEKSIDYQYSKVGFAVGYSFSFI